MKLETKVGAFFIGAILILGVLVIRTKKIELFNEAPKRVFKALFEQVAGLEKQGEVKMAGVNVGRVVEIKIEKGQALVTFSVDDKAPVYRNASANITAKGILGEKYIDLISGDSETGQMPPNSIIPSKNGAGLEKLLETLNNVGNDVKGVTYALNQSLGGDVGRAKLDEIIDNLRSLTGEFRAITQENHAAINSTLSNAEIITGELRERVPVMAKQFEELGRNLNDLVDKNKPQLQGLVEDIRKLAQGFQGTSDNLRSITEKINRGEGTIGKLLTDDTTIQKLNTAVDNVNDMLGGMKKMELRLDMSAALWARQAKGQASLNLELAPQKDYWYNLGVNSTPNGKIYDSTSLVTQLDPNGNNVSVLQNTRTVNTDQSITLSATFAKRLGDKFVAQAGLIEGTGGAGIELRYFDDRFRMGALAYDFNNRTSKPNPRIRFTSSYQFWKGIYAEAGVQDIINNDLRTFFFGTGLRWKDEDLKKLVGLASIGK